MKIEKHSTIATFILAIALLCALLFVLYFIKKDSADRRFLIWQCTAAMVADKPIFGHGHGVFLYNHAAELHKAKVFKKSITVFEQCIRYHNDMDVQMFLAAGYKALGKFAEAEQHLKIAAAMCPARFMPLYELAKHMFGLKSSYL